MNKDLNVVIYIRDNNNVKQQDATFVTNCTTLNLIDISS